MQLQKACGKHIRIDGRLIRIARLDADKYHFLDDPEATLDGLRNCGTRIDLFTFMQRLTDPQPKYQYPMEWDNLAALPVSTFEHWWNQQIGFKARNKAKQAEKKGVVIQEVPFNEFLVRGIWEIYNEPNNPAFWQPTDAGEYAALAVIVGRAFHDAAPTELLIGPPVIALAIGPRAR